MPVKLLLCRPCPCLALIPWHVRTCRSRASGAQRRLCWCIGVSTFQHVLLLLAVSSDHCCTVCGAYLFTRHHSWACCPLILAQWLPTASRGPHSRSPSQASAFQHVTTCRACGSGALRRPVFSSLDCSVLSWLPIHPGQLEPTTLPLRRLPPVSCSVGLSPTLSLPISLALSCSLSPVAPLCSCPTVLYPLSLSFSLSLSLLPKKRGFGSFGASLSPPGFEPSSTGQKRCGVSTGPRRLGI